jgi:3-phosphoshikimate 1-carboxyvinyltransferase
MSVIQISHPTGIISGEVDLDGSKSISNRVLIIRALCNKKFEIKKLANSDDTKILKKLLKADQLKEYNVGHAGTTFRFLTAFLAIQKGKQILTGSDRMKQRPIGPLVTALRQIGCQIDYMEKEGFPPLKIGKPKDLENAREVTVDANISSQYLTALILIAPVLPNGLTIHLRGEMVSESYLKMTLRIIEEFGIEYIRKGDSIVISPQEYQAKDFTIEADWSASSYYFSIVALAKKCDINLKGLFEDSVQGDSAMMGIGRMLGIDSLFDNKKLSLSKGEHSTVSFEYDFLNQPDLAQTIAVICAAKGVPGIFSGLKTLRIKETDRIAALNKELSKVGSSFELLKTVKEEEYYEVGPQISFAEKVVPRFATYKDHRMAMAFAPLALLAPIQIEMPEVVSKSYPAFWEDLEELGFVIQPVDSE